MNISQEFFIPHFLALPVNSLISHISVFHSGAGIFVAKYITLPKLRVRGGGGGGRAYFGNSNIQRNHPIHREYYQQQLWLSASQLSSCGAQKYGSEKVKML